MKQKHHPRAFPVPSDRELASLLAELGEGDRVRGCERAPGEGYTEEELEAELLAAAEEADEEEPEAHRGQPQR